MSKPVWSSVSKVTPCSLADVMSEEMAKKIQIDEEIAKLKSYGFDDVTIKSSITAMETVDKESATQKLEDKCVEQQQQEPYPAYLLADHPELQDDFLLAQMLQKQFDQEYDDDLKRKEDAKNGSSKVSVSYSQLKRQNQNINPDISDHDEEEFYDEDDDDYEEEIKGDAISFNRAGTSGKGENIRTKHDAEITEKKNANKAFDTFYSTINSGDTSCMRLPNRVYNDLRVFAHHDSKREARVKEPGGADRATAERALDQKTRDIIYRLVQADRLQSVDAIISTGKEAVVLHGAGGGGSLSNGQQFPPHCAIKVFKTTLTDFRNRRMYMDGDFRMSKISSKKGQNPRKIVKLWAEKEMLNLKRMYNAGIPCPQPIYLRRHVLVMKFIGGPRSSSSSPTEDSSGFLAAPQLKECASGLRGSASSSYLSEDDWNAAYSQVIDSMSVLYNKCELVHGDLSEYNLLWHDKQVWIIDVSQAVDRTHPHALEFLLRDCRNVSQFFSKQGVENAMSYEEHFNQLTGANIRGSDEEFFKNFALYLSQIREYEKDELNINHGEANVEFPFDDHFISPDDSENDSDDLSNIPTCSNTNKLV